uniref:Uncharacterized protein n=1 Tax=Alexandrium catenella TaxID=2925 RepID=A0A7S1REH1_ALECA|mmetsp:Transcript_5499/g.14616  ORF Transcript_5499/g.14616 Transcript_5499/m.14616 type:complete len:297 (+) Transcript_5499:56-946(+)
MAPPASTVGATTAGSWTPGDASPAQYQDSTVEYELPWEVKRGFRIKALTLASFETWIVLALAVLLDDAFEVGRGAALLIMLCNLLCAAISLGLFWLVRHRYPWNYLLLLITTLMAGTFWSFTENSVFRDSVNMPMQVCIIMAVMITTWLMFVVMPIKTYEMEVTFLSLFVGWIIGSAVNVGVVMATGLPISSAVLPTAAVLVSCVVILAGVAKPMLRCCADDYMIVALAMTANLFLLVSVPVVCFLISLGGSGCSCGGDEEAEVGQQQQQPEQLPPQTPEPAQPPPVPVGASPVLV